MRMKNLCGNLISKPLLIIFNEAKILSKEGKISFSLEARFVPVHKKGDK